MYKIQCLNKISPLGTERFGAAYTYSETMEQPDGILVRSAAMHDMDFADNLLAIARAGAGVNNIPLEKCSEKGIVVFNTPGANANAVKELAIAGLLLASRKIIAGANWVKTLQGDIAKQAEKGKSAFVGPEIAGKKLGVIGLGAIGIPVANTAHSLGMEVYGYDPYLSVDSAWRLSRAIHHALSLDEIFAECDYITLHLPYLPSTKGTINAESIAKMKDGVRILNLARGELADSAAVLDGLHSGKIACYVTDFADETLLPEENVIALPHLGASTPESEDNCAMMAVDEMKDYLENGNIRNSVNLPAISMARTPGTTRICLLHKNVPNTISLFSGTLGNFGVNIENMQSKSRGDYAYTILDVSGDVSDTLAQALQQPEAIVRVRILK